MTSPGVKTSLYYACFFCRRNTRVPEARFCILLRKKQQETKPDPTHDIHLNPIPTHIIHIMRGNETGKVCCYRTRKLRIFEATPIGLADESKESLYGRESQTDRHLRSV